MWEIGPIPSYVSLSTVTSYLETLLTTVRKIENPTTVISHFPAQRLAWRINIRNLVQESVPTQCDTYKNLSCPPSAQYPSTNATAPLARITQKSHNMPSTASKNGLPLNMLLAAMLPRCILSQTTGKRLPITPLYASALRRSLKMQGLAPPKSSHSQAIRGSKNRISKSKVRQSIRGTEKEHRPSPLRSELMAEDIEVRRFPALSPKLLKRLAELNLLKKQPEPTSLPSKTPDYTSPSCPRAAYIPLQPPPEHCHFARLQRAAAPERGQLMKRSLALNRGQQLCVARLHLLQISLQQRKALKVLCCEFCRKHAKKVTRKAAKKYSKTTHKANGPSREEEEKRPDCTST